MDVSKAGRFYAGNLLIADNEELVLAVAAWAADSIRIEVHNPTDAATDARVWTPAEITGYQAVRRRVAVAAGSTVYLE